MVDSLVHQQVVLLGEGAPADAALEGLGPGGGALLAGMTRACPATAAEHVHRLEGTRHGKHDWPSHFR